MSIELNVFTPCAREFEFCLGWPVIEIYKRPQNDVILCIGVNVLKYIDAYLNNRLKSTLDGGFGFLVNQKSNLGFNDDNACLVWSVTSLPLIYTLLTKETYLWK